MDNFTDTNLKENGCGSFLHTNTTGVAQVLIIRELIKNTLDVQSWGEPQEINVAIQETITLKLPQTKVWEIAYKTGGDTAYLYNLCAIDECILAQTKRLLCEENCSTCGELCDNTGRIEKYLRVTLYYDVLQSLLDINFDNVPTSWHSSLSTSLDAAISITELINMLNELCSCKKC